jgi:NAD(P)-dependent dehydrogenase (short-subunit alcohol dehydrogenase family)
MVTTVVDTFGGVDILVNLASQNPAQPGGLDYVHATDEVFLQQLNVKVLGFLRTARPPRRIAPHNGGAGSSTSPGSAHAKPTRS